MHATAARSLASHGGNNMVSIPLGIFIGLLASFVQSLGLTIQRKSHVLNAQLHESQQKVDYRRPLWLLGFAIFISSNILGSLVQIASLPVVILAPLGAVSLLWNAFFARFILGDVFSPWMILGTFLIAGGAVLIAVFGIVPEPTRSLEDLLELFRRPAFVAYFSLLGAVVVVALAATHIVEFSLARKLAALSSAPPAPSAFVPQTNASALTTGVTEEIAANTEQTPLLMLDRKKRTASIASSAGSLIGHSGSPALAHTRLLIAISYASFSGIISGMCLLFAKSGVELLLLTVKGHNQFWKWQSWMLLIALGVFALLQLWYLHKALVLADPTLVCPSAFCFYNLSSIVNGLVYFDQFSLISPLHLGLVVLGIIILLAGVWVVSIQAGGGGVDVARQQWQEGDEVPSDEDEAASLLSASSDNAGDLEAGTRSQSLHSRGHGRPAYGAARMERQSVSESQADEGLPSFRVRAPTLEEGPALLTVVTSSQSVPTRRRPSESPLHLSPTSTRTRRRRRATITPAESSPPTSVLGGGLSIGLGPMSPGFSIVPLDRRRRSSGFADVVADAAGQRRSLNEESAGSVEAPGDEEAAAAAAAAAEEEEDAGKEETPRNRWRWVRRVFVRRR